MAAPAEITLKNINGKYSLNKSLSDDQEPILVIQKVGWIQRKAIGAATLELTIKIYEQDGVTRFDTGIKPSIGPQSTEERFLDWDKEVEFKHPLFGAGKNRSKLIKVAELEEEFLSKGWEDGTEEVILTQNEMDSGIVTKLVHGFELVGGERHYVRHVLSKNKKGEEAKVRLVYNYEGSA
ncbi:unnamed protein product [Discula destructiva]